MEGGRVGHERGGEKKGWAGRWFNGPDMKNELVPITSCRKFHNLCRCDNQRSVVLQKICSGANPFSKDCNQGRAPKHGAGSSYLRYGLTENQAIKLTELLSFFLSFMDSFSFSFSHWI